MNRTLCKRGISVVAGTIFDDLTCAESLPDLLRQTDDICRLLAAMKKPRSHPGQRYEGPYLTVMDWGHDERDYSAGHSERATRLDDAAWATMMNNVRAIAMRARDAHGVRAVVHPHAGGYIEFADEIERLVDDLDDETVGLCLDTGHLAYSGVDPVAALRRHWDRLDYIHFKDIDHVIYEQVMHQRIRFFEACAQGVMCPIGQGSLDYEAIRDLLREKGYGGYITIEQERYPQNKSSAPQHLSASRAFLGTLGF